MTDRFSQSRLIDQRRFGHRTRFLGQRAFRAYFDLTEYYWEFGRLFVEDSDLADVCGLHVQSFRRIREQLIRLFEVDDAGLWRDTELEAERTRAMRRSATNRANGRKGGQARWEAEDPEGMGWGPDGSTDPADDMANSMAKAMPVAMGFATENGAESGLSGMAGATAIATPPARSGGSIDRSSIEDSESIDRSNTRPGESHAMANSMAVAMPLAMPGVPCETATGIPVAKGVATTDFSAPASDADLSDRDLHALALEACGDNVTPELRRGHDVVPLRELMRDGFHLRREILPLLRDRVKTFDTPLRTFRKWIRKDLEKLRAAGSAPRAEPSPSTSPALMFVPSGTEEWTACQARERAENRPAKKAVPNGKTGQTGNWFAAPLPPLGRPAVAAE